MFFVRLFVYSHKNNIRMFLILFSQYSHKVNKIKERPLKHLLLIENEWKIRVP